LNDSSHLKAKITLPLSPADLQSFMVEHGIAGEIILLASPTPTVEAAAKAVEADPESIVKTLLFLVDEEPALAIASGLHLIDRRVIAAQYGVGRKRVKLAEPEAVLRITGYEVGSMPPFGHLQKLTAFLDVRVLDRPLVYAGGGAENALVRIDSREIVRATGARVIDLLTTRSEDSPSSKNQV
jgi:prolyl-tRNA editing enzyme YbaK/EbsC (Cys-tRNA(Pro) deacylase)